MKYHQVENLWRQTLTFMLQIYIFTNFIDRIATVNQDVNQKNKMKNWIDHNGAMNKTEWNTQPVYVS